MNPHRPKCKICILSKVLPYTILAYMPRAPSCSDGGFEGGARIRWAWRCDSDALCTYLYGCEGTIVRWREHSGQKYKINVCWYKGVVIQAAGFQAASSPQTLIFASCQAIIQRFRVSGALATRRCTSSRNTTWRVKKIVSRTKTVVRGMVVKNPIYYLAYFCKRHFSLTKLQRNELVSQYICRTVGNLREQ